MLTERRECRFTGGVLRRIRRVFLAEARCSVLGAPCRSEDPLLTLTERVEVDDGNYRRITEGVSFEGRNSMALDNVDCSILSFVLYVRATVNETIALGTVAASENRLEVFLSFSAPTLVLNRIGIRNVRLRRERRIRLLLCILCDSRIAT